MSLLERNMKAFEEKKPVLYHALREGLDEFEKHGTEHEDRYRVDTARNGSPYLVYESDSVSIRLNSNYNPEKEAEQWAKQYSFTQYKSVAVMLGFGNGYFSKAVLANLRDDDILIILEPDRNLFFKVMHEFDISDLIRSDETVFLFGEEMDSELFTTLAEHISWANMGAMKILVHPKYDEIYKQSYDAFKNELVNFRISMNTEGATEQHFGEAIAYNTMRNYKYLYSSHFFEDFEEVFPEDVPGVVVAAGPSLDKNINILKELKGKAIIIAVDTALRRLHLEGIVPDFVVSVDPRKDIDVFENSGFEELPFFCKIDSTPEVIKRHTGKKIWVNPSNFLAGLYDKLGIEKDISLSGGSVATMAFTICELMKLKTIVLVGQDLAYAGDGNATHAGGEKHSILNEQESVTYVPGNNGDMVKTRGDWVVYLKWFERKIRDLGDSVRVINATEGGARINGAQNMTLREVLEEICHDDVNIQDIIDNILKNNDDEYNEGIAEFYGECINDLNTMNRILEKAISLCNRFIRKYSKARILNPEVMKCMSEISRINKRISDMPVYMLIDEMVKHKDMDSIKDIFNGGKDEYSENMDMIKNTKHIFALTREAAQEMLDEINKLS